MDEKQSQDFIVVSREAIQKVLRNFCESVDSQYGKRNSPANLKWSDIHMLYTALLSVRGIKIKKHEEKYFINYVMDYVELVMCFVSSYEATELKKQIKYVQTLLNFISVFFNETDIANTFIRKATMKVFDLFLHGSFSNISKRELLTVFNRIASKSSKEVRVNTAEREMFYMYKLVDSLFTYGDYATQADVLETIFRLYGAYFYNNEIKYDLLPECNELGKALLTEISVSTFDADVRSWLNKFNQDSTLIFSIPIQSLMFGKISCKCPDEGEGRRWLDFNLIEPMVSFFAEDEHIDHWNRIIILPSDVEKVEIKRKFSMNERTTTIVIEMCKPYLSYSLQAQKCMDNMERNLIIIISNDEKEKITKLISHVLPRLFGASFVHTSARISDNIKKVYKPLGLKVSRLRSTNSGTSSCQRQSNEGPSSTLKAIKYSAFAHAANGEKMEQNVAVESSKKASQLWQLLFNESKTSSGKELKYSKTTVARNNGLVDSPSCIITEFSACSSRDSVNSNVFSIDSNMHKTPSMACDSEMLDDWKKSQSVSLKDHIFQLNRTCSSSLSANEQLMSEDVFHSITDEETEEYETAAEFSEPFEAIKTSCFKGLDVMDLVDISKPNVTEKRSQNVSETSRQMTNSSVLDYQNSVKLALQNDSPKTDNPPIIDCLLEPAQESELTQDLFEAAIEKENVSSPQSIDGNHSDSDSDIFQRTTQVFRPAERNSQEPFTALSMKVNIGIPEQQFAEQIFQSQLVKSPLIRNSTTVIENGVEMIFIDLTSEDDNELTMDELAMTAKSIHSKSNRESDFGHNLPKNTSTFISERNIAPVQEGSVIKPGKFSKQRKITNKPKAKGKSVLRTESPAFELLQEIDSQTAPETVQLQRPESNNQDLNVVPKPEMSSTSYFVENVVEPDNSKPKIERVERPKVKKSKSKINKTKIALEEKAYSGSPDSTEKPLVLWDQAKKDIVKPRVEELEEQKSTIAKSNSEIALEGNLAIPEVADIAIRESALAADKPIPTLKDVEEQTVSQAMSEQKITLEDSADNENLVLRETKTNQASNSQVSGGSVQNGTSEIKQVMEGAIPKASLEDIDVQQENQMSKTIVKEDNLEPNTGSEAIVREIEANHDLGLQIPSTAATLWEKYMSPEISNKANTAGNVPLVSTPQMSTKINSEAKSKNRPPQGITSKASDILNTAQLNLKVELIREDQTISMEVLPKKIKKAKPKAKSTKKKIKSVQTFPQPDFDRVQEADVLMNKDTKADNSVITIEEIKPKRAKKTKFEVTIKTAKSPECNDKNSLLRDNIEGITVSQKSASNMDEENELKIEKPKKHSEISGNSTILENLKSESSPKAEVQTVEAVATTCNVLNATESKRSLETQWEADKANKKTKKNAKTINILNILTVKPPLQFKNTRTLYADTVDSQKAPQVENEMAEPIMQNFAKDTLQSNTITDVKDQFQTSSVRIVEAVVHASANGEKEAAIISSKPMEQPISNSDTSNILKTNDVDIIEANSNPEPLGDFDVLLSANFNPKKRMQHNESRLVKEATSKIKSKDKLKTVECPSKRKLYRAGSYSYLEHLDLDASSGNESQCTPLNKKRNFTNTAYHEEKARPQKTAKQNARKRRPRTKNTFGLQPTKHRDFIELFNESRRKHLEAAYAYENHFELRKFGESICQNLDIAVRCEANDSSPDNRDISLLNKSEKSTPEFTLSSSDHFDWPEIEVEDPKGNKINIIQNITLKRKSPQKCITQPQKMIRLDDQDILPTFDGIIPSPKEFRNAEMSDHVKDIGLSLIKQILNLLENEQVDSLKKLKILAAAKQNFEGK